MLLILMYHKISEPSEPNRLTVFREHLVYLKNHFSIVTPGDSIFKGRPAVCLTFDDAYYDFYHCVYPLLQELNIKAVLGIPTVYIAENTTLNPSERLSVPYPDGLSAYAHVKQHVPFCTWTELREMVSSQYVYPASHSHTHANLCHSTVNVEQEITLSKNVLETQLNTPIHTFIYPYGKMNATVHQAVRQQYRFGLRIGAGLNLNWQAPKGLLYRVNADPLWMNQRPISPGFWLQAGFNYALNRLRGK